MRFRIYTATLILNLILGAACSPRQEAESSGPVVPPAVRHYATAPTAIAVTTHPLATRAAVTVFAKGGNAVDAAVAAALTLGVVEGHNSGIGGGCFMLIHTPKGETIALDGREMAPAAAHRDMFVRDGIARTHLSQTGPLASGVPGSLAVYDHALRTFGTLPLDALLLPAAEIAARGFPVDDIWARRCRSVADSIRAFPYSASILLREDGTPRQEGDLLVQIDLANTYRGIAEHGINYFYRGPIAKKTAAWMAEHGGLITAEDFANYRMETRDPVRSTYRGRTILGFPPPSSGGIHVAQILNILENFEMPGDAPADRMHLMIEAMKPAFADRAHWLGDPDHADVPRGLIDKAYAADLASRIDPEKAVAVSSHGIPPRATEDLFGKHTTHFATADTQGFWVACTSTVNTAFGSKVLVPGTGVVLNNQMDDFSIRPGVPNAFGLIGAEANAVAPGKRPLSSMSPTIVLEEGAPVFSIGAAGGPTIITQVVQAIVLRFDLEEPLSSLLSAPRYHHQWSPDEVRIERDLPTAIQESLLKHGHHIKTAGPFGTSQAIAVLPQGGFEAAGDPRVSGLAEGF